MVPLILLIGASFLTFHHTIRAPFVFDDGMAVRDNPTIRDLRDWKSVFSPPNNASGVTGRPIVNFSLALDHATYGLDPRGYHLTNIIAHGVAGFLLFACLRFGFRLCKVRSAGQSAFWVALLWVVHPLQSESVASVIQRTEILAAIFLLGVILCLFQGSASPHPNRWYVAGGVLSAVGMATKEIMFVAPIVVLLLDRALLAGTLRDAWRRRRAFHLSLLAGWTILGWLVYQMGGSRGTAAGFGTGTVTWWEYFLKQWDAIVTYLRLCFWPHPLIVDYGTDVIGDPREVILQGVLLSALGIATLVGLRRNSPWALLGAWFFLILGPSSSVMPLAAQTMAEHRMYLPLAAVLVPLSLLALRLPGRLPLLVLASITAGFFATSYARTFVYESELKLWTETVKHRPGNERAHHNLAGVLNNMGRHEEALVHFQRAVEIQPLYIPPRIGIANCHFRAGRLREAVAQYESVLTISPDSVEALGNLGVLLCETGQLEAGLRLLRRALQIDPGFADVHFNLGTVLLKAGQLDLAEKHYREALRLRPLHAEACNNLGAVLLRLGRRAEAEKSFRRALEIKPDYSEARANLQVVLGGGA